MTSKIAIGLYLDYCFRWLNIWFVLAYIRLWLQVVRKKWNKIIFIESLELVKTIKASLTEMEPPQPHNQMTPQIIKMPKQANADTNQDEHDMID